MKKVIPILSVSSTNNKEHYVETNSTKNVIWKNAAQDTLTR